MAGQSNLQKRPKFKGEVMLCDDSELNCYVIKNHLLGVGLDVVTASDGRECVDIVESRMKNGEKPFDLIFMDMYMPVMNGTEAADVIAGLGSRTPMVALTGSSEQRDRELCAAHGMENFLSKPVSEGELWDCLHKYFTPLGFESVDQAWRADEEEKRRERLYTNFVRKNRTAFEEINAAMAAGDIKLAHRLAHTLGGVAGLMEKAGLRDAARAVERSLADGETGHIKEQMVVLGMELMAVLDELSPLLDERERAAPGKAEGAGDGDKAKLKELLEKLEPMLRADSAACMGLADELRAVPGTGALLAQMEDYEFEEALKELEGLKKSLEGQ